MEQDPAIIHPHHTQATLSLANGINLTFSLQLTSPASQGNNTAAVAPPGLAIAIAPTGPAPAKAVVKTESQETTGLLNLPAVTRSATKRPARVNRQHFKLYVLAFPFEPNKNAECFTLNVRPETLIATLYKAVSKATENVAGRLTDDHFLVYRRTVLRPSMTMQVEHYKIRSRDVVAIGCRLPGIEAKHAILVEFKIDTRRFYAELDLDTVVEVEQMRLSRYLGFEFTRQRWFRRDRILGKEELISNIGLSKGSVISVAILKGGRSPPPQRSPFLTRAPPEDECGSAGEQSEMEDLQGEGH